MDRLQSIEVFARVVELGSISAAAEASDLSPSMVAKHLRAIEERLGARLFNRTTRRQSLTEVGQVYYDRVLGLIEAWQEAEAGATRLVREPRGRLRLASPVTWGAHGLPPLLAAFHARYPDVEIDLVLSDLPVDLVADGFDAAFTLEADRFPDFAARALPAYRMTLGASPAYLDRRGVPRHPNDLIDHECLAFSHFDHPDVWRLVGPEGEFRVPVRGRFRANNGQALLQAALAGVGIVHQPDVLLRKAFRMGELVRILEGYDPPARSMSLVFLPDRRMGRKLRAFVDFASEFDMAGVIG